MPPTVVTIAIEGLCDEVVAKKILTHVGLICGNSYIAGGKGTLNQRLTGYNSAARFANWLVLRDMDRDAGCAPELLSSLLPQPSTGMHLRIAVRAIESWLLGDQQAISRFLSVRLSDVPIEPEKIIDPKRALLNLISKSKKRELRRQMLPTTGTSARVGPGYTAYLIEYVRDWWRPEIAKDNVQSLMRCLRALQNITGKA